LKKGKLNRRLKEVNDNQKEEDASAKGIKKNRNEHKET
jgi:hypothetical protein